MSASQVSFSVVILVTVCSCVIFSGLPLICSCVSFSGLPLVSSCVSLSGSLFAPLSLCQGYMAVPVSVCQGLSLICFCVSLSWLCLVMFLCRLNRVCLHQTRCQFIRALSVVSPISSSGLSLVCPSVSSSGFSVVSPYQFIRTLCRQSLSLQGSLWSVLISSSGLSVVSPYHFIGAVCRLSSLSVHQGPPSSPSVSVHQGPPSSPSVSVHQGSQLCFSFCRSLWILRSPLLKTRHYQRSPFWHALLHPLAAILPFCFVPSPVIQLHFSAIIFRRKLQDCVANSVSDLRLRIYELSFYLDMNDFRGCLRAENQVTAI